jgi:hypothetical protein
MVSGKNILPSFELADVKVTSSIEATALGEGKPSASQIEDVKETYPTELTALPEIPTDSIASEEDKNSDYDPPPDGGLFAWMQVLGGWLLTLNSR